MAGELTRTPIHAEHVKLEGRLVPFAGFEMPVQYSGIPAEHRAVRERAGLFDISHMGEFRVEGLGAEAFVNVVVTNDVTKLELGQAQYTMMCGSDGGIIDDLLVYRFRDWYRLVVNAANIEKDLAWVRSCLERYGGGGVEVSDESAEVGLLALQGPDAEAILAPLADVELPGVGYYRFAEGRVADLPAVVSRTGYTGEDGFELYCDAGDAAGIWRALIESGAGSGLEPAGLGARDTLRLEMGYALYGNDIDESTTPLEARLGWTVKLDKDDFVGREALQRQRDGGVERRLCGFILKERGFPRAGYPVKCDGLDAGTVRSGTVGPTVGRGIGTAYLPSGSSEPGTALSILIRGKEVPAEVVRMPFYEGGSLKR